MNPFREIEDMRRRMQNMFRDLPTKDLRELNEYQRPDIDIMNKEKEITVIAELPGINKKDIKINAEPNFIEIEADSKEAKEETDKGYYYKERSAKSFKRSLSLPAEVKPEKAEANYNNGVLEITLPKANPEKEKGKRIDIK